VKTLVTIRWWSSSYPT